MQSVIETLDGWVPCDVPPKAMRWMPPEQAVVERQRHDEAALKTAIAEGMVTPEMAR